MNSLIKNFPFIFVLLVLPNFAYAHWGPEYTIVLFLPFFILPIITFTVWIILSYKKLKQIWSTSNSLLYKILWVLGSAIIFTAIVSYSSFGASYLIGTALDYWMDSSGAVMILAGISPIVFLSIWTCYVKFLKKWKSNFNYSSAIDRLTLVYMYILILVFIASTVILTSNL